MYKILITGALAFILLFVSVWGQDLQWAYALGDTNTDRGRAIHHTMDGSVWTAGYFSDTIDLDGGPGDFLLGATGSLDGFISKTDSFGNFLWGGKFTGVGAIAPYGIASDDSNNVYIGGSFNDTTDFDPGPGVFEITNRGGFVCKLMADGTFGWARAFSGTASSSVFAIGTDSAGSTYIAGTFQGTVDIDPGPAVLNKTTAGSFDIFLVRLDPAGNFLWGGTFGDNTSCQPFGLDVDRSGNMYTTGFFQGTVDLDIGPGTANFTSFTSNGDIFVLKMDQNGNYLWGKNMGNNLWATGYDIRADVAGNVFTTGTFGGTIDLDPGPGTDNFSATGAEDIFVQKLDNAGNYQWTKQIAGAGSQLAYALDLDAGGNIYLAGRFNGTTDFDPGPSTANLTPAGDDDVFVTKLDVSGNFQWAGRMGGALEDQCRYISVAGNNTLYMTGWFKGPGDFDPGPGTTTLTADPTYSDIFILRIGAGLLVQIPVAPEDADGPKLFPNPAKDLVFIDLKNMHGPVVLTLYDLSGKTLQKTHTHGGKVVSLDLVDYPAGIYLFSWLAEGQEWIGRVVKD